MGFLFQYPERQLFGATPLEDVEWGAMLRRDGAAERALEAVGLPPQLWATSLRRLSRGEKRRVALAGLLVREPEVLFLDEPAVGLDPEGQALLWQEVEAYRHGRGAAVLVATHWPEPWLRCAANVLCLEAGVVLFSGPVMALPEAARRNRAIAALLPVTWRLRLELEAGESPPGAPPEWVAAAKRWLADRAWSAG
ncbi:MAG: ATP-binding cassette domain-containing protein [Deltaproteobacteria bacterium]|nr:ATP-binding cassette domain-containing protein [Deltaproteobacteria bacterium]